MQALLPLGIQDFEDIRSKNYIFVDKTQLIYQFVSPPIGFYFLSRPRRFGKSLLISTLASLFKGRRDLFRGLWIEQNTDWAWHKHPVITIDFNKVKHSGPQELEQSLFIQLQENAELHGIKIDYPILPSYFSKLILDLEKKYDRPVVVLVDEYDKPIISHIGKGEADQEIARKNREVLKQFFGVLKGQDVSGALRLVFITGVSKFTRVSIFSDLNNLRDLSMEGPWAELLGYTDDELSTYFLDHIHSFADRMEISDEECSSKLKFWYNGYRFTDKDVRVYNPYSFMYALETQKLHNYWFETGTPTFLVELMQKQNYPFPDLECLRLDLDSFTAYDIDRLTVEALLFQTGYLTIQEYDGIFYTLSYPNQEVKNSFTKLLYQELVSVHSSILKDSFKLLAVYLEQGNPEKFIETVNAILSAIPYSQISGQDEAYYHTVFYLMLAASGALVFTEVLTSQGRMDMAVEFKDKVYIIELKCNQNAGKAIRQIREKNYADKYRASGREINLIGINFSTKKRKISGWKWEKD
jgi:hypothetical protein